MSQWKRPSFKMTTRMQTFQLFFLTPGESTVGGDAAALDTLGKKRKLTRKRGK
jgi:hypothetical protein